VEPSIVPAEDEIVTVDPNVEVFFITISAPLPADEGLGNVIVKVPEAIKHVPEDAVKLDVTLKTLLLKATVFLENVGVKYKFVPSYSIEPETVEDNRDPLTNFKGATVVEFVARVNVPVIVSPALTTFVSA
jgi:hypothetical protein